MLLADFLDPKTIAFEQRELEREQVYLEIIQRICSHRHPGVNHCDQELLDAILAREKEAPMAYAGSIAIPHVRLDGLDDILIGMTFLEKPLDYDGIKVDWIILILTDKSSSKIYLNIVAALLRMSKDPQIMENLRGLKDGHEVIHFLKQQQIEVGSELTIADIMVKNPVCVSPQDKLSKVDSLLNKHSIAMLPVVDDDHNYLGEINILDVLKVGVPDYLMRISDLAFLSSFEPLENLFEKEEELSAEDVMRTDTIYLNPTDSVVEAVFHMLRENRRYFCVLENGKIVGVITAMDVFKKVIKA
ncbi:MAG: CBS domain-containing protein [Candidatus Cloacimonadaceae bacterium]|jgi:mannitol/fructose-specific phosphotransferase system IIA component (Ntr-type)/predicted transcriptional regulator|nr:PTS sugar transporter subunit IIA [Candidatus Cloacimonadota bacterium]MDX9949537.1 PTS sugar transporter subunit IIA [Candidatus Syntrophosphaera sp.]NLN85335.1 PTS transporter subunit EIIA [Candidatus Cloacimonadota bacterium]